jgi:hypothetical protein
VLTFSFLALQWTGIGAPALLSSAEVQSRPVAQMRFERLDRNNDGRISRDEWNGNERSFRNHDWNGDGVLSGKEVRAGAHRNTELADHDPNQFERNLSCTDA